MSGIETATIPHAQELESILAIEQPNLAPKIIRRMEKDWFQKHRAERLTKDIATKKPSEVASSLIIGMNPKGLPQDSYHIYSAATELFCGSYWHAFSHIEKISDERKDDREHLGKIAIEQCFDPHVYRWGTPENNPNKFGSYELLLNVIKNPKSKLKHLVSIQDLERCTELAFTNFVKNSKEFSYSLRNQYSDTEKSQRWLYEAFCEFLNHTYLLNKNLVIKTIEETPEFEPGFCTYLYLNYIFKQFKNETTGEEKAKMFWPVLKELIDPIEEFDKLEKNKKLIAKYEKYAKSDYCRKKAEEKFKGMLKEEVCENFWQTLDYMRDISGKRKIVRTLESIARTAQGEEAKILVKNVIGHFEEYVNLATVYVLKSHCVHTHEDNDYSREQKIKYMEALDKIEHRLGTVPRGDPAWDELQSNN